MSNFLRRFLIYRPLRALFISSLVLALVIGQPSQRVWTNAPALAQDPSPAQLVRDGANAYQAENYRGAIDSWLNALETLPPKALAEQAIVNANLARAYQHIGSSQSAINYWEAAAAAYEASGNPMQFGRMLTEQAQVHIDLGQFQRAAALLCGDTPEVITAPAGAESPTVTAQCLGGAYSIAQTTEDWAGQVAALGSLAETFRLRGQYDVAQDLLTAGLALGQAHDLRQYRAPMLNSQGNTYARQLRMAARRLESATLLNVNTGVINRLTAEVSEYERQALTSFNDSIRVATTEQDWLSELQSHLSRLSLFQRQSGQQRQSSDDAISTTRQRLGQLINQLPPSVETAYAAITLAKSYQTDARVFSCQGLQTGLPRQQWLEAGRRIAEQLGDARVLSFALGELGHLDECRGNLEAAARLTRQAQAAASDTIEAADSLYLWQWQLGRIHRRQHEMPATLAAYEAAIATLDGIREEILTADQELQFDFRDTVEPIYREYVELQLDLLPTATALKQTGVTDQSRIQKTLKTVDALRLAELQNFFGDDCVLVASADARERLLTPASKTTVISSVVLSDRTALIANFPDGAAKVVWINDTAKLEQTVDQYRMGLKRFVVRTYDQTPAQQLYQQLIGQFEPELTASDTETLVFVHDKFLRNIPMAALYDGRQYLIQRFAIATTPSLNLTASSPRQRPELRALAIGLSKATTTESGQEFEALPSVPRELETVYQKLPGSATLLDDEFTLDGLQAALQKSSYSILHLATHGQFSTIPEETFLVTGPGETGVSSELTFGELETLIHEASPNAEPIDLITLTACETATGDDRATLGLAGVAIRAGARSAIASLWKVEDATAAQFASDFYSNWQRPGVSKAKAMQIAQIAAIEAMGDDANPGRWAPLIMVGNWQ